MKFQIKGGRITKTTNGAASVPLGQNGCDALIIKDRMMDYAVDVGNGEVKPGEHWCNSMTLQEAIKHTLKYLKSASWGGRTSKHKWKTGEYKIIQINDVSEYAKKANKFYKNAKFDEAILFLNINKFRLDHRQEHFKLTSEEYIRYRNQTLVNSGNLATFEPHQDQKNYAKFRNELIITGKILTGNESVMRWGKTFGEYNADYDLINDKRFPHTHIKTIIYTGKPKVKSAWKRDIDHIKFEGWHFKDSQIGNDVAFEDNDTQEYIFASAQGNHKDKENKKTRYPSRIAKVIAQCKDTEFRKKHRIHLILEECHANLLTPAEQKFINDIAPDHKSLISGTMGNVIYSGVIKPEDVYRFTILDALKRKREGHERFKNFPSLVLLINQHLAIYTGDNPLNPDFAKVLSWNGTQPVYTNEVDNLMSSIMDDTGSRKNMPLLATSRTCPDIDGNIFNYTTNHGWIVLPSGKADDKTSVGAQSTLKWWFENTTKATWKNYVPLPLSAGGMSESEVVRQQTLNEKTQCLSAGALNTGTTFPLLDHQIWLKETSSFIEFWQTVGRLLEILEGKKIAPVIMPGWNMYVNMMNELATYCQKPGQSYDEIMEELLDLIPAVNFDGKTKTVDYQDLIERQFANSLKGSLWSQNKILNHSNISSALLTDNDIENFPNLDDKNAGKDSVDLSTNEGHSRGKNRKIIKKGKITKSKKKSIEKKIQKFCKFLPSVLANAYAGGHKKVINHRDILTIPEYYFDYHMIVGAKEWYSKIIFEDLINTNEIDKLTANQKRINDIALESFADNDCLTDFIQNIQSSVPMPAWRTSGGRLGTGITVSEICSKEWTDDDYSKDQTWAVFGTGEGYIYFSTAKKLHQAGHSYEKIFTKMLTGYDIDEDAVNELKDKVSATFKVAKRQIRIYTKDYFTLEDTVNFDNFIINPPYLDGSAGNIPVAHTHIQKALDHWSRKGKGVVITKSSPLLSDERNGDQIRATIFKEDNHASKVRLLPDDAFKDATVKSMYIVYDPINSSEVDVYGKTNNKEYTISKDLDQWIFPNNLIRSIVEKIGTINNKDSLYPFKRVSGKTVNKKLRTVSVIANKSAIYEETNFQHKDYGNYGVGITFQINGDIKDAYRNHTKNSCLVNPNESIKQDYSFSKAEGFTIEDKNKDAQSTLYQIQHPLNAFIQAYTRTSDQSSRTPQFKFCVKISTEDFYKKWSNGNPSVDEYFDHFNITQEVKNTIINWYKKYV
jgi:hypothetical protein